MHFQISRTNLFLEVCSDLNPNPVNKEYFEVCRTKNVEDFKQHKYFNNSSPSSKPVNTTINHIDDAISF